MIAGSFSIPPERLYHWQASPVWPWRSYFRRKKVKPEKRVIALLTEKPREHPRVALSQESAIECPEFVRSFVVLLKNELNNEGTI